MPYECVAWRLLKVKDSSEGLLIDFTPFLATIIGRHPMNIEIHNTSLEARIQKQLQLTDNGSVEEVLLRLLETQEEQDRWLLENRDAIDVKIRRGITQLNRGEGIPEERLDAYLKELKAQPE
jgi:DNA-binding phage protein